MQRPNAASSPDKRRNTMSLTACQISIPQLLPLAVAHEQPHLHFCIQFPRIVAARKLRHVTVQMFLAHFVVHAIVPTLEHGPEGFQPVCVNHAVDVLAHAVPHNLVLYAWHAPVGCGLVRVDPLAPISGLSPTNRCNVPAVVSCTTAAVIFPVARSLRPATAVLPTGPRPAWSFLEASLPPI